MIPPTPLPIPSFDPDASDASAAHLLEFLQNLSDQFASDNAQTSEDYREACLHLIKSLNDHLLKRFPPPHEYIWSTLHERTKLTEVTLEFIPRATLHVGDIFHGKDSFAKSLVLRLLDVCHVLDTWLDVPDISDEEGYSTPSTLRRKAVDAIVAVLQCLGNSVKRDNENDGSNPAGWELLRSLISECIESCTDMQSTVHADEVLSIALFTQPRIAIYDGAKLDSDIHVIRVANPAELPLFMTSMLEIFLNAFYPRLLSQSLVADVFYRLVTVTQRTYQHLLSTACRTTAAKRARATVRLVNGLSRALQDCPDLAVIGENIRSHVLLSRIQDGPTDAWKGYDTLLAESLSISLPSTVSVTNLKAVAATLTLDTWGEDTRDLHEACCIYVRTCLQRLDSDSLIEIRRTLAAAGQPNDVANLVAAITAQLDAQAALRADSNRSAEPANVHSWRVTLRTITQAIVEPDDLAWMDDDESTSDSHYVSRAISDIDARFERPLYNPSAPSRIELAAELLRLPCALARHSESGCVMEPTKSGVNALQPCLRVSMLLLDGPENEATPLVRKAVYDALARSINHQTSSYGGGKLEHVTQLASRGLKDVDRSVRLGAGRCLVQLVKLYQRLGRPSHTDAIFGALSQVLSTSDTCLHETAIITSGSIAKIAASSILVKSLLPLLSALGQSNPVLKGVAYMQLSAIAKHRQTTHYSFLFPLMDRIAPFLITRMRKQPSALHEVARFLSVRLSDFLNVTLVHTLPQIFFNQDRPTLEAISAATQKKNHSLFLTHESKILARAFMASKPGQTRNILNFITSVLNEAAGNGQIDIDSLIGSSIVNLIAELVLYMGDEDSTVADQAVQALRKVEGIVSANEKQASSVDRDPISAFLEPHMLGVITHINDVLQNKHTVEMKRCAVRSLGRFVRQIGDVISNVAPQVLATLQSTLMVEELADVSLESWDIFLRHLDVQDIGSYIGPTSAAIVTFWDTFSIQAKKTARQCLEYIVSEIGEELAKGEKLGELADLAVIPEFKSLQSRVKKLRGPTNSTTKLQLLLNRITNDNQLVVARALEELKSYLIAEETLIRQLSSGDFFHPLIGRTMSALLMTTSRDGENADHLRLLAFECIGALGALDPDRLELGEGETKMVVINNFTDDAESQDFAVHLIKDVLVGAFRSTSDTQYQTSLAYTIQELMRFCNFTTSLVMPGSAGAVSLKARSRWSALPKYVIETITPFLASRYTLNAKPMPPVEYPIYPAFSTYREWISAWTSSLLDQVSGPQARTIFSVFAAVIRNRDVGVAHHLLPHLVLNVLISGKPDDVERIRGELLSVLEDQVDPSAKSTADKRDLSAQTVFSLMDHLNKWVRSIRQQLNARKPAGKRARNLQATSLEEQLVRVDSMVSSIDQNLMAKAALRCKAYARALMSFEQQVVMLRSTAGRNALSDHYERLHEMYAQLDEPDGMEGIATLILTPSLEHQIRQNESTGRWTAAQSCWEVQLQRTPDELRSHLGLLRCLKNIGHYDTLRTHVEGVLRRRPDWEPDLIGYQVESACMVGKWEEVQQIVNSTSAESSSVLNAKVLLAMRSGDEQSVSSALSEARKSLGAPIIAAGSRGYRRSYEAALDLHLLHELRVMHDHLNRSLNSSKKRPSLAYLDRLLATRLESIQPSFRFREPIISLRRTALALRTSDVDPMPYIGRSWLLSAKLARKAGYTQTAYSAVLQAQQLKTSFSFIESAKLTRLNGEPLRALQDLEHWLNVTDPSDVIDLTGEDAASGQQRFRAKALLLRAKWESESNRFDAKDILVMFQEASEYGGKWESGLYHYGQYQDESFKSLSPADKLERGSVMNLNTIKWFGESMLYGDKYIYQTVPRLLTLWLDMAEQQMNAPENKELSKATVFLSKHVHEAPAYKWYTAFPQLVSRIDHPHPAVWSVLQKLIIRIIQEYPRQALWGFASSTHSPSETVRKVRAHAILGKVKSQSSGPTQKWILATVAMTRELLAMCNLAVAEKQTSLSMSKNFPRLLKLAPSDLIIPLQESIIASLPPAGVSSRDHEPFPQDAPQFHKFFDEVEVMNSLAKPRKITIQGSDGQIYLFLAKPKDDLRKDARLMDLYSIINKLLKSNSESRRRRLRIRTYGVVTLNETCGLIQWVPNTIPIRTVVTRLYESHGLAYFNSALSELYKILPGKKEEEAVQIYNEKVFPMYKPVLHEWFVETFPEPSVWLASRLAYSRTNAVMCMVGFIIGLGDRHLENILLDLNSGDLVHVDFNCLFEKGRTLEIPERVPFRLTQNIVDGLGVTGVEGVFRIACELTLQLLRDNRDCLISILDAFIHDPLTDWYEERIKLVKRGNSVAASVDLKVLAKNALNPIGKKLRGIYAVGPEKGEREITTGRLVQLLIEEATDTGKLARMYVGWGPWV